MNYNNGYPQNQYSQYPQYPQYPDLAKYYEYLQKEAEIIENAKAEAQAKAQGKAQAEYDAYIDLVEQKQQEKQQKKQQKKIKKQQKQQQGNPLIELYDFLKTKKNAVKPIQHKQQQAPPAPPAQITPAPPLAQQQTGSGNVSGNVTPGHIKNLKSTFDESVDDIDRLKTELKQKLTQLRRDANTTTYYEHRIDEYNTIKELEHLGLLIDSLLEKDENIESIDYKIIRKFHILKKYYKDKKYVPDGIDADTYIDNIQKIIDSNINLENIEKEIDEELKICEAKHKLYETLKSIYNVIEPSVPKTVFSRFIKVPNSKNIYDELYEKFSKDIRNSKNTEDINKMQKKIETFGLYIDIIFTLKEKLDKKIKNIEDILKNKYRSPIHIKTVIEHLNGLNGLKETLETLPEYTYDNNFRNGFDNYIFSDTNYKTLKNLNILENIEYYVRNIHIITYQDLTKFISENENRDITMEETENIVKETNDKKYQEYDKIIKNHKSTYEKNLKNKDNKSINKEYEAYVLTCQEKGIKVNFGKVSIRKNKKLSKKKKRKNKKVSKKKNKTKKMKLSKRKYL